MVRVPKAQSDRYSSGPNNRVHTPIYFLKKNPANMLLLGTTRLLIFDGYVSLKKLNLIHLYEYLLKDFFVFDETNYSFL